MKLYQTYSNTHPQMHGLFRVTINDLYIVRWSDEPLRYLHSSINFLENLRIPRGTTAPNFWSVK